MQQAAVRWLRRIRIENPTAAAFTDLQLGLTLEPALAQPWTLRLDTLPAQASIDVPVPDLPLAAAAFANLVERQRADLIVTIDAGGQRLAERRSTIDLLAYNEWPGPDPHPALLAAFVAPNHPALPPVLQDVAARLQQATGRTALDGYQSRQPSRALAIAAAVHDAIVVRGITYVQAPPSFERVGQKVRTPEQVLGERLGTCLDLAVLYAALLEHAGLHPFLVLVRGHAFVGVWLTDGSAPEVAFGPAVELRKRLELGALVVIECTAACASNAAAFAVATEQARQRLLDDDAFQVAIDVVVARRQGIRPLPVRTQAYAPGLEVLPLLEPGSEYGVGGEDAAAGDGAAAPQAGEPASPAPPPKDRLEHWKQKLLDLSMFNRLLNFAETKKTVRLCAHDLEALCERMQQGGRVRVLARPDFGAGPGDQARDLALASQRAGTDVVQGFLADELRAGRLRAELDAEALDDKLVEIFRHARTSLEESGANTLYLAIGFLKYFESRESEKPRRAPLLLLPLSVERTSVTEGVRFVLDDAEPRLNQTLLQFLQRDFELRVGFGELPPEGEHGVDAAALLDAFRRAVVAMPRWEVETTACIGFFSFTKYLMWLDLADRDGLLQSPVLRHLVERPGQGFAQDAREYAHDELDDLDPATLLCPKDADSSQLAAVLAAVGGRSFVLEGPPGTGKSQTITNLVAQALADGQRVLFVAEKRAALEVVQRRLAEVGLGPFCLELHSQKSGPKAVLEQLRAALEFGQRRPPAQWDQVAAELQQVRTQLNRLVHDLHRPREHGSSVFAAMAELVPLRGLPRIAMPALLGAPRATVDAAQRAVGELAGAARPIGVPANAPWWGVQRADWSPALQRQVEPAHERLHRAGAALAAALPPFAAACGLSQLLPANGPSRAQWQHLLALMRLLRAPLLPPSSWLRHPDWRALEAELQQTVALGVHRDAAWSPLASRWRRELLGLDLDRLLADWRHGAQSFVGLRWWRLRAPKRELQPMAVANLGDATGVGNDLAAAVQVRNEERALLARTAAVQALGVHWRASLADWAQVTAWCQWVRELRQLLVQLVPGALAPDAAAARSRPRRARRVAWRSPRGSSAGGRLGRRCATTAPIARRPPRPQPPASNRWSPHTRAATSPPRRCPRCSVLRSWRPGWMACTGRNPSWRSSVGSTTSAASPGSANSTSRRSAWPVR
jgi:Protein of unknown function (DUF4011)/AAA domain